MIFRRAEIGIILIAFTEWVAPSFGVFDTFPDIAIQYSLFILTITVGLVLYVSDRKEFSDRTKGNRVAFVLLTVLGLILTLTSLWLLVGGISLLFDIGGNWGPPLTLRGLTVYLLFLSWSGLALISGILWSVDGVKMWEGKTLPLKKEIDLESQTKYPKDLFSKYVKQYPHNPAGVLEWHIHKKMKEGKTREQAIKELEMN